MAATREGAPAPVSFAESVRYWLKFGFISFGGPAGQISLMHQELVERRRWISEHRFLHALNYAMLLPGPEAQQLATYIGWLMHGVRGGIAAGALFMLPSLLILIALSWIYLAFGDLPAVAGILYGIKPAVTAIVVFAAYRIGSRTLQNNLLRGLAVLAFVAIAVMQVAFPWIVLAAGVVGYFGGRAWPELFRAGGHHGSATVSFGPALIDDATPLPAYARMDRSRLLGLAAFGLALWGGVLLLLVLRFGWSGALTQMAWFFSKAALVTFGGAYAVLPYVYQGGVEQYGWLTAGQMIDGLALGETTPGPLIMVVAFVGFVGAWTQQVFGPDALLLAGIAGASVATLFTFLPSFLFIFLGAPVIEATRGEIRLTAPLTAITAAVVGVILSLAVFFAYHVFWPQVLDKAFEWYALLLCAAALVALFHFRVGIVPVILACAVAGYGRALI